MLMLPDTLAWLLAVTVIGLVIGIVARWRGALPGVSRSDDIAINIITTKSLGPRQQIILISAGRRILLLGVSPTSISLVADLTDTMTFNESSASQQSFMENE